MITISTIREQIRTIIDPIIIKLRQELYGPGNTFGQYIADNKIPPNIPRTGTGGTAIIGSGVVGYIPKFKGLQTLDTSVLQQTASGIIVTSGVLVTSGIRITGAVNSTGTSLGLDTNNNLVKITSAAGISSVPQRFGWYLEDFSIGVNGPVYYFNTAFDLLEYDLFFKSAPQSTFTFRVEMTDNYNPAFGGVGVVWWNVLAANGNSGASDTSIAAGTVATRVPISPEITPLSRSLTSQPIGSGLVPSGDYGIYLRLNVISSALSDGVTISMLLRSRGGV